MRTKQVVLERDLDDMKLIYKNNEMTFNYHLDKTTEIYRSKYWCLFVSCWLSFLSLYYIDFYIYSPIVYMFSFNLKAESRLRIGVDTLVKSGSQIYSNVVNLYEIFKELPEKEYRARFENLAISIPICFFIVDGIFILNGYSIKITINIILTIIISIILFYFILNKRENFISLRTYIPTSIS